MGAHFTGVGLTYIFFFLPLKIVYREVLFPFRRPLLLTAGAVGTAVAGGAGDNTGAISRGSMLDVLEWQNEAGRWIFPDGSHWPILTKTDLSSARDQFAEDELHKK